MCHRNVARERHNEDTGGEMGELDVLKQRMEHAALRLQTAHSARERECTALNETWERIRTRFIEQTEEMAALRARIAELENEKDELSEMVRGLLSAIEDGVDHMRDGSVPRIAAMAGELLEEAGASSASADSIAGQMLPDARDAARHAAMPETATGQEADTVEHFEGPLEVDFPDPADESLSPGIRDLIGRIEGSFANPSDPGSDDAPEDEDELARDLREIQNLRNELNGLRARISVEGR